MFKILPIFLGGPMGPLHPVWALAAIHPRWGNRYLMRSLWDSASLPLWTAPTALVLFLAWQALHHRELRSILLEVQGRASRGLHIFWDHFGISIALFWVRRGLKMIGSHRAPSSLNMSSYRAIWTHFRPNSMIFIHLILQLEIAVGIWDRFTIDSR